MTAAAGRPVALVTGASRGIGRAIARRLARDHALLAAARSGDELDSLAREIRQAGGLCRPVVVDLTDREDIARSFEGERVDVLVNNAGIGTMRPLLELTPGEWHAMVDVNLNALFHVTRAVLPGMLERGAGHVVVIGSIAGRNGFVGGTCYSATKHAVMGFAESLMLEVRDAGVKVSVIMPGSVATELFPAGTDTAWMLTPEDVAESVAHVIGTPAGMLVHRLEVRPLSPKRPR